MTPQIKKKIVDGLGSGALSALVTHGLHRTFLTKRDEKGTPTNRKDLWVATALGGILGAYNGINGADTPSPTLTSSDKTLARVPFHDPSRHGGMGRVWQSLQGSPELRSVDKDTLAKLFMSNVGKPGADTASLHSQMKPFGQDTSTGQMMNVLFNKHHGPKTASAKFMGRVEAFTTFGVW